MTVLLSQTLKEYLKEKGETPEAIEVAMPFSMKKPKPKKEDNTLFNDMVGLYTVIKLFEDFDEGLKHFKK